MEGLAMMNQRNVEREVRKTLRPGITDNDLFDLRVELGEYYLHTIMGMPPRDVKSMMRNKQFWDWWVLERWVIMDRRWLLYLAYFNESEALMVEYLGFMRIQIEKQPYFIPISTPTPKMEENM